MQAVEKTTSTEKFGDQSILVVINTHAHVEHDAGVGQLADDLHFLDEVSDMLVSEAALLQIFFDCNFLSEEFTEENLPIASFSYRLDDFNLLLLDQES